MNPPLLRRPAGFLLIILTPLLFSGPLVADENPPQPLAVEEAMRRSNDYYIATFPLGNAAWNRGAYHTGNIRAWEILGVQDYYNYAVTWSEANSWLVGPEAGTAGDADAEACGQTYIDLYKADSQPVRIASIQSHMDTLVANPASVDDWSWIDAFFMAGPTFARLSALTADPAYFTRMESMYFHMKNTRALYSPAHGLWYRDANRKAVTGSYAPEFWGRGNGWVIAACARVLEQLPKGDSRRTEYETMLQTMAAALLPLQGSDGFWRSNLLFPNQFPSPETSATAFFTYAIAYGINEGLLNPETYTPVVMKAWNGMNSIALHPNGKLGYTQTVGYSPGPSTYEGDEDYGYGAFLLAGTEVLRLLGGPAPIFADAGAARTIMDRDANFVETITLDASRSSIRSGGISHYSWWLGSIFLGEGPQLTLDFPYGCHAVTLRAKTATGESLFHTTTVQIISPRILVTASGNEAGNPPQNTLDGSLATRWSHFGAGQWIRYELPNPVNLNYVNIAFYQGNQRRYYFDLQVSADGTNWNTAFSGLSNQNLNLQKFSFPSQPVQFIRYIGNGNTATGWNSLTEVSIPVVIPPLDPAADNDGNGLPAAWEIQHFGIEGQNPEADPNGDGVSIGEDFLLGSDPTMPNSQLLQIESSSGQPHLTLRARAAIGPGYEGKTRKFRLLTSTTLNGNDWQPVPDWESIPGDNLTRQLEVSAPNSRRFYRIAAWLE